MPRRAPPSAESAAPRRPEREGRRYSWRRLARLAAMQTLCEMDSTNHALDDVLDRKRETERLSQDASEFLDALCAGAVDNVYEIDGIIERVAPSWPVSQMAMVDRNLLRMAIYEIAIWRETPPGVAINEAVELAKAFGSESSPRFVNGVLGAVARGMEGKTGRWG